LLEDFTEYKCKIENSYGEDTGKMVLVMEGEIDITLKGIVSRDSVVCFFGVIRWI
jgi:hypothetical protein